MLKLSDIEGKFGEIASAIRDGKGVVSLSGLTSNAAKAFILARLQPLVKRPFVVLTDSNQAADTWLSDLQFFGEMVGHMPSIVELPSFEAEVYSGVSPHAETLERRALALWQLTHGSPDFLILPPRALIARTVTPEQLAHNGMQLERDAEFAPEKLVSILESAGYVREDPINNIGQFSIRGGIVDVWSPQSQLPSRIEFFGDTVDSIREFDPETQLSTDQIRSIDIAPMREFMVGSQDFKDWSFFAGEHFTDPRFARSLKDRTNFAGESESFAGWEFLLPLTKPLEGTVFDYIGIDAAMIVDEPAIIEGSISAFFAGVEDQFASATNMDEIGLEPSRLFIPPGELSEKLERLGRIEIRSLGSHAASNDEEFSIALTDSSPMTVSARPPPFLFPAATVETEFDVI
ncbi:hypothetical protein BH24ACI3_BH24ACI3_12620 [soil metagenome]